MERQAILLLGIGGAGKGTLGAPLADELGGVHLSAGRLLRERVASGGRWSAEIQDRIDRGLGVPAEISYGLLEERLGSLPEDAGLVLDGFPREIGPLPLLDRLLGGEAALALLLDLPRPIAVARLLERETCEGCGAAHGPGVPAASPGRCDRCGGALARRADDSPASLTRRVEGWSSRAPAIVDHYRGAGILVELDASVDALSLRRRAIEVLGESEQLAT
jgi:adenylate kinase